MTLRISPYVTWKGISTNSAIPSFSRPDLNVSGVEFKANPIKHWRKQLMPNAGSGASNRRAGISMPMDLPGGAVYLGNVSANTDCLLDATADTTGLKEYIKYNDVSGCLSGPCNPEKNRIRSATTILSKKYYTDHHSYMRSRCNLYEQKLTALPVPDIVYLDTNDNLLPVTGANAIRQTQNCATCPTPTHCQTIYKPNNAQYAKQGAVDSSDRITRLKLNTVNTNAASYKATFGSTAPRYLGMASTPYFLKSKYQPPKCDCAPAQERHFITIRSGGQTDQPPEGTVIFDGYFIVDRSQTPNIIGVYETSNPTINLLLLPTDPVFDTADNMFPLTEPGTNFTSETLLSGLGDLTTDAKFNLYQDSGIFTVLYQDGDLDPDYYTITII